MKASEEEEMVVEFLLLINKRRPADSQKDENGEECKQSNFLYHFHIELLRQRSVRWNGNRNQGIDEVVVKEWNYRETT